MRTAVGKFEYTVENLGRMFFGREICGPLESGKFLFPTTRSKKILSESIRT